MRLIQLYKSRKYMLRILLSITLMTVIFLTCFSTLLYYASEKSVVRMQKDYNQAALAQVNYNISYMDEIAKNMVTSLFWDSEIIPLMSSDELQIFDLLSKLRRLNTLVTSSWYLDSIVVYNGPANKLYSGGNAKFKNPAGRQYLTLQASFRNGAGIRKLSLTPMNLSGGTDGVDTFSYVMYETLGPYKAGESALALTIKPEWLYNNMKLINDKALRSSYTLLMDGNGNVLRPDDRLALAPEELSRIAPKLAASNPGPGYSIMELDGEKQIVSYSRTVIPDWFVVSVQPYDTVIQNIQQIRQSAIGLTILFVVLSVVAAMIVTRGLYKPIQRLLQHIKTSQLADGVRTEKDELAFLTETYSHAAALALDMNAYKRDNRSIIRAYHLRQLILESASYTESQLKSADAMTGMNVYASGASFAVLTVTIDEWRQLSRLSPNADVQLIRFAILNIAEELLAAHYGCMGVEMRADHLVFLICAEHGGAECFNQLVPLLSDIQTAVSHYYKITISMAISGAFHDFRAISEHYHLTQHYLLYKLVFGRGAVIEPEMVKGNMENSSDSFPGELEKRLIEGLKAGDKELLETLLDKLMRHISTCNYDQIVSAITHMPVLLRQTLKEINVNRVQPMPVDLNLLSVQLLEMETLEDMQRLIRTVMLEICDQKKGGLDERNEILIETIKGIVQQNYQDMNLSLQSVSGMMKLSGDYIGRLFRKGESMSVADYINAVRIAKAQELLRGSKDSINEVMVKVGYANQSYFFKLFKKKLGCTPGEYRLKKSLSKGEAASEQDE
ncbi:AraC family transcriptional regulator [Paenibacillus sacheonensis]|uniref:Helix-turn-helix domain-containing protein n=1 Tax=Paenibacillus sacheonensis TaxID=742054 RepID=A0A7X4YLX4_9BACL|nr:helix-turn-helix domain-containing protein [Paenibacillus sacheonensis]MBM7565974.1 AraC-like DNA-binding protein [Paenibacillus sacheonensis]NBC68712.1 helix-turn-helix domain-containing protein [Paenibacillus sacheonensis]